MANTRIYRIEYPVTSYYQVTVERPVDITEEELLASVTRDDLANGEDVSDGWDMLKDAAREGNYSCILDEDFEEIEFNTPVAA